MLRLSIRQHMVLIIAIQTRQFLPRRIHRDNHQRKIAFFVASEVFHRGIVADGGLTSNCPANLERNPVAVFEFTSGSDENYLYNEDLC